MLEQPSLLLRPWLHSFETAGPQTMTRSAGWLRIIVNPATNQSLGFAAWDTTGIAGLLAWLGRKRIQVYETEDESLLLTLCRPWGWARTWEVRDAEERRVAHVFRDSVYDGYGARLATISMSSDGSEAALRGAEGIVLGTWQDLPGQGCYVRFGKGLENHPFVRMAVLAVVLAQPPWPGDLLPVIRPAV